MPSGSRFETDAQSGCDRRGGCGRCCAHGDVGSRPILQGRWLSQHALVLAVGATGSTLRELDDEVMHSSFVVASLGPVVERESGDVRLSGDSVGAEIGEILARPEAPAIPRDGRVVFKSVGMAIEDLTAARLVWESREAGQVS